MNRTKCMLWQKFAFYGSYNKFIIVYGNMEIYDARKTMKMVRYLMDRRKECEAYIIKNGVEGWT